MSVNAGQIYQNNLQRKRMQESIDRLGDEILILSQEASYEREQRDNAREELDTIKKEHYVVLKEIKEYTNEIGTLESMKKDAMVDLIRLATQKSNVQELIDALHKKKEEKQQEYDAIVVAITEKNTIVEDLKYDEATLKETLHRLNNEIEQGEEYRKKLEKDSQEQKQKNDEQMRDIEKEKEHLADAKSALDKYKKQLNTYAGRLNKEFGRLGLSGTIEII